MTETESTQLPRCVVTLDGRFVAHHSEDIAAEIILGTSIADLILSPGGWDLISSTVQKQGKTTFEYAFKKPGLNGVWHGVAEWYQEGDRFYGTMLYQFEVTRAYQDAVYMIEPVEVVSAITALTDKNTELKTELRQNENNQLCVPGTMTLHKAFHIVAQNAFRSLPLLAHKETLELCTLEATDKIRIYCPTAEDARSLYLGRWDIAECANLLYPQIGFELYIQGKDQPPLLYKTFSYKGAVLAGRLKRKGIENMIDQDQNIGNGHSHGLLLPPDMSYREIFSTVMHSTDVITLVTEADSKPIIVSNGYAKLTEKTVSSWIGNGSLNKAGWATGELERMQRYLERDGNLQNFEYQAYLNDFDEVTTWYTSFQRVFLDGEWMRLAKVLDIVKSNLAVV